jgi:Growth regulator
MLVTIQKWGNSQGIRIPKKILENVKFKENERVDIQELNGDIIIKKITKEYSSLDELFNDYEGEYKCEEYDFGEDVGFEKI